MGIVDAYSIFFGKNTTYFSYMQENGGKMQNNYFVFIKLRVGEYVEYIWECEVLAQNKEKCLAHREKCRNFAAKLQLDYFIDYQMMTLK